VLGSLDATDEGAVEDRLAAQAADVADMLGACVASGAPLERATVQVAAAVESPARELLAEAAARQALGAHPGAAWLQVSRHESTAPIARAIIRSLDSGAPMADALTSCASELRDIRRARIEAMAQAVAVKAVGPLGLCFLPAFLLIGVVPLVAGLIEESVDLF
jgi:pilus assembly protein TadC